MPTLALTPRREAPAWISRQASLKFRIPPEALTPISGPTVWRISRTCVGKGAEGAEPRRGLDELGPGLDGQLAAGDDLLVGQVARLQDHLDQRRPAGFDHGPDVVADEIELFVAQGADVDHHVDLGGAVPHGLLGLEGLGGAGAGPEREADHGADQDAAALELFLGEAGVGAVDADGEEAEAARLAAEVGDLFFAGVGAELGVVDHLDQRFPVQVDHGFFRSIIFPGALASVFFQVEDERHQLGDGGRRGIAPVRLHMWTTADGAANSAMTWRQAPQGGRNSSVSPMTRTSRISFSPAATMAKMALRSAQQVSPKEAFSTLQPAVDPAAAAEDGRAHPEIRIGGIGFCARFPGGGQQPFLVRVHGFLPVPFAWLAIREAHFSGRCWP